MNSNASYSWLLSLLILSDNVIKLVVATGTTPDPGAGSPPSCNQTCDYIEIGNDAYCNNRNLTEVPRHCSHLDIVFLDMRGNILRELYRGDFQDFTSLRYLDLSQNSLERLRSGTFAGARQLLDIYMFKNQLINIHHDAFSETGNIRSIYLSKNNICALPRTALRGLPLLEIFFMSHNKLIYINRHQFIHNKELTHVGFSYNQLELILPETFKHLSKLEYLDLSYNNLHYIQSDVFGNLQSLQTIKFVNNSLTSDFITYDLLSAPNLEVLDLSSNMIETIPAGIDQSKLGKLRLAENPLVCDCAFYNLQTLYTENLYSAMDDSKKGNEDWQWVMDVNCSNGESLIETSIICPTTTSIIYPMSTLHVDMPIKDSPETQGTYLDYDSRVMMPIVITAVAISGICVIICIYVIVSWVRACYKEDKYRSALISDEYKKPPMSV